MYNECLVRLHVVRVYFPQMIGIEQDLPGAVSSSFSSIFVFMTSKCSFTTFDFRPGFGLSTVALKKELP